MPSGDHLSGLSLQRRIAIALSAAGVLLLALVIVAGVLLLRTRSTQTQVVDDYFQALRTSQAYLVGMLDSETAIRGYALSRNTETLQPLDQAGQPWAHPISPAVARLLPDQPQAASALTRVEQDSRAWYDQWGAPTIQRTRAGQPTTSDQVLAGKKLFDTFRQDYGRYVEQVQARRATSAQRLAALTSSLFATALASAVLALITGLVIWSLLRRWVDRPATALAAEARLIGAGDLSHQVQASGPREFIQLGAAMESMRERLVAQIGALERSRQETLDAQAQVHHQAEELRRSNRELEQFAYVASHDLQEPLRKVASFCQLLERRYAEQLDERAGQYIHFAVDGAQRMQQLINDLLDFSRVGRVSASAMDVDTGACLRAALSNVETARVESGASIQLQTAMPVLPGEPPLLTQLFQNLVSNAIKFRAGPAPVIQIGAVRAGPDWEFWCTDNGIGIPAEYADRVFLIFQRLHPKERYEGTGIGLAMCKKIVEYHGGRIWVGGFEPGSGDPQERTGTTIRWTLPAEPAAVLTAGSEPEPGATAAPGSESAPVRGAAAR